MFHGDWWEKGEEPLGSQMNSQWILDCLFFPRSGLGIWPLGIAGFWGLGRVLPAFMNVENLGPSASLGIKVNLFTCKQVEFYATDMGTEYCHVIFVWYSWNLFI